MQGLQLQELLAKVQQDDLSKAEARVEAERAARAKIHREQGSGLTINQMVEQLSKEEEEGKADDQPALQLHKKETTDAPKRTANGFFPPPPK